MEVIYSGLRKTPEVIVEAAAQEDVDAIGVSILSGAHMTIFPRVLTLLKEKGLDDVLLFGGGIIPDKDIEELGRRGVGRLFTPGASTQTIISYVREWVAAHRADTTKTAYPRNGMLLFPLILTRSKADFGAVDRLQPFRPLLHIKLHSLSLLQALVSLPHDGLEMNKNVLSVFTRDETIALRVVEPLHGSLFHAGTPFRKDDEALETSCREIVRNRDEKRKVWTTLRARSRASRGGVPPPRRRDFRRRR